MKMKFSIGYNFDKKLLGLLNKYHDNLEGFYFPIPRRYLGSGRDIEEPKDYPNQIEGIIKRCNLLNITSQLLLNATYEGGAGINEAFFARILRYIKRLKGIGLKSLVVTNPLYIARIREEIKDIRIESSVNCYVRTVEEALYFKGLGVDVITIDRDINRNIPLIGRIKKATGLKIRLMLNEGCVSSCPYRVMHYNYLAQGKKGLYKNVLKGVFWDKFCFDIYRKDPLKIFRIPFIPPQSLKLYRGYADYYKLSTRALPTWRIKVCLDSYIKGRFRGNLLWLLDSPGISFFEYTDSQELEKNDYFKKISTCKLNCIHCGYCAKLFKKTVLRARDYLGNPDLEEDKKAIRLYKKHLKYVCSIEDACASLVHISEAYLNLKEYKKTIHYINDLLKLRGKFHQAYFMLGLAYLGLKDYNNAVRALKREPRASPFYIKSRLALLRSYKEAGKKNLISQEMGKIRSCVNS